MIIKNGKIKITGLVFLLLSYFLQADIYATDAADLFLLDRLEYNMLSSGMTNEKLIAASYLNYKLKRYTQSLNLLSAVQTGKIWPDYFWELHTLNYIKLKQYKIAKDYWQNSRYRYVLNYPKFKDETKAKAPALSYIIPGSGLIAQGHYGLGVKSLVVNGFLIWGIVNNLERKNYAIAFLLLFFEIPFYQGSIDVTKTMAKSKLEAANNQLQQSFSEKVEDKVEINFEF